MGAGSSRGRSIRGEGHLGTDGDGCHTGEDALLCPCRGALGLRNIFVGRAGWPRHVEYVD